MRDEKAYYAKIIDLACRNRGKRANRYTAADKSRLLDEVLKSVSDWDAMAVCGRPTSKQAHWSARMIEIMKQHEGVA